MNIGKNLDSDCSRSKSSKCRRGGIDDAILNLTVRLTGWREVRKHSKQSVVQTLIRFCVRHKIYEAYFFTVLNAENKKKSAIIPLKMAKTKETFKAWATYDDSISLTKNKLCI